MLNTRRHGAALASMFLLIGVLAGCAESITPTTEPRLAAVSPSPSVTATPTRAPRASSTPHESDVVPIDVQVNTTPDGTISPLIYGVAVKTWEEPLVDAAHLQSLGTSVLRWGGNQTSTLR